jgi:hypothetical protein
MQEAIIVKEIIRKLKFEERKLYELENSLMEAMKYNKNPFYDAITSCLSWKAENIIEQEQTVILLREILLTMINLGKEAYTVRTSLKRTKEKFTAHVLSNPWRHNSTSFMSNHIEALKLKAKVEIIGEHHFGRGGLSSWIEYLDKQSEEVKNNEEWMKLMLDEANVLAEYAKTLPTAKEEK